MAVLYAVYQPFVCNHRNIQTMCDVNGCVCDYHRTGVTVSESGGGNNPQQAETIFINGEDIPQAGRCLPVS